MTIVSQDQYLETVKAEMIATSAVFNVEREANRFLSDPDAYSSSHLTDEQFSEVLKKAYGL